MKFLTRQFSLLFIIGLVFAGFTGAQDTFEKKDLPNLYKINANFYRGGQPTETGVAQLKQTGIKTIIDLRSGDQQAKREEGWATAAGIRFINVPMSNWFGPKDIQVDKIIALIDDPANQPVFVHCKRGADRTGTVVAVYRISREGWNAEKANEEAEKFGFGWWQFWMKDYINDYYRDLKAKTSKPQEPSIPK